MTDTVKLFVISAILGTIFAQLPNINSRLSTLHYDLMKIEAILKQDK
jgi:hypothetical protein